MHDEPPCAEADYIASVTEKVDQMCESNAPTKSNVGHQEELYNFHDMHNQSTVRSRGYGIGNPIVGLPPNAKDAYYTQPGSPYNDASIRPLEFIGSLDKDGGRKFKSDKWAERLKTPEEKEADKNKAKSDLQGILGDIAGASSDSRGSSTVVGSS